MPKGITRIENYKRRADGWWVRLQRRGVKFSKFFKDSDYTSKSAAKSAAREHYRQLVRDNPKISRREYAERETARTGKIIGVQRVVNFRFGHEYESWKARWSPKKGVRSVKTFSVEFYGEREAKRLAIEARLNGLAGMREK